MAMHVFYVALLLAQAAAGGGQLQSPALAKELDSVMAEAKLEAIALPDPQTPDRFIAALVFPKAQLLMVSARHPSPDMAKWRLDFKQYREVYGALQEAGLVESRTFFQDIGADGLPLAREGGVDVMYRGGVQTIFDANGDEARKNRNAYAKKLREADAEYSRLLRLAIDAVKAQAKPGVTIPRLRPAAPAILPGA